LGQNWKCRSVITASGLSLHAAASRNPDFDRLSRYSRRARRATEAQEDPEDRDTHARNVASSARRIALGPPESEALRAAN
jgi:hypothetical protein